MSPGKPPHPPSLQYRRAHAQASPVLVCHVEEHSSRGCSNARLGYAYNSSFGRETMPFHTGRQVCVGATLSYVKGLLCLTPDRHQFHCQEWLTSLVEKSKAAGAKGARSKGPKGGKWTKEEVCLCFCMFFSAGSECALAPAVAFRQCSRTFLQKERSYFFGVQN